MIHDDVGRHLARAGTFERAAAPLGLYMAWCAHHALLSEALDEQAGALVVRLRYREITGSELLVAGCGGLLADEHLNAEGRAFTAYYYPGYLRTVSEIFGMEAWRVPDDWPHYDRVAPVLTQALVAFRDQEGEMTGARRRWWEFWH